MVGQRDGSRQLIGPSALQVPKKAMRPPTVFCEVEAPGTSATRKGHTLSKCLICCQERPWYVAVGRCGHTEVCWMCAVRLRAILRDNRCPVCKEDLEEIALVGDASEGWKKHSSCGGCKGSEPLRDERLGIVYENADIRAEVERLFDYTCWLSSCSEAGRCFNTLDELSNHLWEEHYR